MRGVSGLVVPTAVRWSDVDAFGHVNNVAVLRLLEEARIAAFDELAVRVGGGPSLLETGVVVARHEIEYRRQLMWRRGPVPVRVWVTAVGGSSFELGYAVGGGEAGGAGAVDGTAGEADVTGYADGVEGDALTSLATTTVVAMGPGGTAARRLGPAERAALGGWTGEPVPFRPRPARR